MKSSLSISVSSTGLHELNLFALVFSSAEEIPMPNAFFRIPSAGRIEEPDWARPVRYFNKSLGLESMQLGLQK